MSDINDDELERVESAVSDWAAKHPEPVYPSWSEWLGSLYPMMCTYTMGVVLAEPIPADIAEKLGIEPKGADNNG